MAEENFNKKMEEKVLNYVNTHLKDLEELEYYFPDEEHIIILCDYSMEEVGVDESAINQVEELLNADFVNVLYLKGKYEFKYKFRE